MTLADIYYIVFRHKWKMILIAGTGLVAALLLPLGWSRPYQSEAKLLIRYVLESHTPTSVGATDSKLKSPDERGENVINTELEILTSLDLALAVANDVGPEKILAKLGGGNDPQRAASVVRRNLLPEVPNKSNVIRLVFQHPDASVVQPVLTKVIAFYLQKHSDVHRPVVDDFLTKETDDLGVRLTKTEEALQRAKTNAHIISVEDSKKAFTEQMARVQQAIFDAEAELAERQGALGELSKQLHSELVPDPAGTASNAPAATNLVTASSPTEAQPASADAATNGSTAAPDMTVPPERTAEYKRISGFLEALVRREQDWSVQFTPESSLVKSVRAQIAEAEKSRKQLETDHPELLAIKIIEPKSTATASVGPRIDLLTEQARVTALNAKIRVLISQMAEIRKQASTVDEAEGPISKLQRKKELEEAQYKYFSSNLEQSRIDEALGAGRVSNISTIQLPSPPYRESSKLQKTMAMLFFGAIGLALALAFAIELYFDRSLRRPSEVEAKLGLPLFVTIPRLHLNGHSRRLKGSRQVQMLTSGEEMKARAEAHAKAAAAHAAAKDNGDTAQAPLGADQKSAGPSRNGADSLIQPPAVPGPLHAFYEALRDRLILYFEVRNLTHKPKLVAVTSCAEGSGVTTTAAGLAATLSETGEGNVLLVDMNLQGAAHQFYKGKLECGLDDALERDKRGNALVQDNLYLVSESGNGDKLPRVLPKRFKHLVPKLKASDYDYIIFDLPPISQISATSRLARFMDMVFVVVESEKTDCEVVKRATSLLAESKANVGVILNKARTYVPKRLQQEL
jgi:succinoglycan biosynthesis transport protein ExoP